MTNDNTVKELWAQRSQKYKDAPEGVLPKSYPKVMNNNLHGWMLEQITLSIDKNAFSALDLGAGYGRLALELVDQYPDARVDGLDISSEYVALFNKKLGKRGKAVQGDMRSLPFADRSYDYVICVTTFLYMFTRKDQLKALSEMLRVLKPDGKVILLERSTVGYKIVNLGGLVPLLRGKKYREITSLNFTPKQIEDLFHDVGGEVIKKRGMPMWTIAFFNHYVISRFFPALAPLSYAVINFLDRMLGNFVWCSLYVCYTSRKR